MAVSLFRSTVHFLKPDSGVNSIASIRVFEGTPDPNHIIYMFSAIVIVLVSVALQFSDFEANQEQTVGTLWILRGLNGGLPFVMFTVAGSLFLRFSLNEDEHAEVRAELDRRAAAGLTR
jgi:hypothetical protein